MDVVPELIEGAGKIERGEIVPVITEFFGNQIAEYDIGGNILLCDISNQN